MNNYPRFELVHVTYEDDVALCYLNKIEMEYDYDDKGNDIPMGEYITNTVTFDYDVAREMFSETFRWKMFKMSVNEYYDEYVPKFDRF